MARRKGSSPKEAEAKGLPGQTGNTCLTVAYAECYHIAAKPNFVISRIPCIAKDFNFDMFYETVWYRYEPVSQLRVFYTFIGVFGPLGLYYCYDKIAKHVKLILEKHTRIKNYEKK